MKKLLMSLAVLSTLLIQTNSFGSDKETKEFADMNIGEKYNFLLANEDYDLTNLTHEDLAELRKVTAKVIKIYSKGKKALENINDPELMPEADFTEGIADFDAKLKDSEALQARLKATP